MSVKHVKVSLDGHDDLTRLAGRMLEVLSERFPEASDKLRLFLTVESETQAGSAAQTGSTQPHEVLSSMVLMHIRGLEALVKMNPALVGPVREMVQEFLAH